MKAEGRSQKSKVKGQKSKVENSENLRREAAGLRNPQSAIRNSIVAVALGLLLSAVARPAFAQLNGSAPRKNPYTGNAAATAEGKELYKKMNCYGCHGMQGGGGMGPSLIDETWKTGTGTDLNLLDQIRNGKGQMPPYKTMVNDEQAWKMIAFIRSLYKGDPKKIDW
jgi:cytochrome c(L)